MPWHPGWHPAASNMHDARQHQAERGRGLPGLWSLRNLGALEAGRMAARGSDSRVLVRDEAWKVAPKSIELEAGRLAGGGVSPPSAQAYASPSHLYLIRVGPPTCSKQGGALWHGRGSSALGPLPWKPAWRYLAAPGRGRAPKLNNRLLR